MKKFINKYMLVALSALAFSACSDDDDNYVAGEVEAADRPNIYFSNSQVSSIEVDPSDPTEFDITIMRDESKASQAITLPLEVQVNDGNVFNVPESVTFNAGESEATIHVTYPNAEEGITYNLIVNVPNDYVSLYNINENGICSYKTAVTRIKWESIGEVYWVDGIIASLITVQQLPLAVQAEKAIVGDEIRYRFDSPYASICNEVSQLDDNEDHVAYIGYPYNEEGDLTGNVEKMVIRVTNGGAHLNQFHLGNNYGYGDWISGTIYGQLSNSNSYPLGKYNEEAATITFPKNSLFFYLPAEGYGTYICSKESTLCLSKEACLALCYAEEEEASWVPAFVGQYKHCVEDLLGYGSVWGEQIDGEAVLYVNENNPSQYCIDPWIINPLYFTFEDDETLSFDVETGVEYGDYGMIYAIDHVSAGGDLPSYYDSDNGAFVFNIVWYVEAGILGGTQDVFTLTGEAEKPRSLSANLPSLGKFYCNKKIRKTEFKVNDVVIR